MSEAARSRRPDLRFEPQMDRPAAGPAAAADPLAELARLVGHEDPFRNVFKAPADRGQRPTPYAPHFEAQTRGPNAPYDPAPQAAEAHAESDWDSQTHPAEAEAEPQEHAYDQHYEAEPEAYELPAEAAADHGPVAYDEPPHSDDARPDFHAPPLTPDVWAEQAAYGAQAPAPTADEMVPMARAPRRPLAVLAAVLVLTGGGLAATFLARTGPGAAMLGREAPTILAASGPNKIKQDDAANTATPEDVDGALLNRNNPSSGPAKVVNSQEQPIDLAQLPKPASGTQDPMAQQPASNSPFPEPKKVKTFLVRPDGTMISSSGATVSPTGSAPVPSSPSLPSIASMAAPDPAPAPPVAAPRPATPKTAAKTPVTPKSAPTTIADAAAGVDANDAAPPAKARQPASAGVKPSKPKPVEVADASASITPAATGQGGAFGLQLAAAPSEQEARDLFARLQKKYSAELGPYRPTIHKAESGDKSVYRLRVGNLSQDQAKSICTQLQASGGSCFVVRN